MRAGAQDYLIKGQMDGQSLLRALRHAIERKRTETSLRVRIQQLTEQRWQKAMLASSMDELLASLIRELNNPLARISVQLEDLLAGFPSNDPKYGTMQGVRAEVERMGRLVANLLQASIESAGQNRSVAPDLAQYLREHNVGNLQNDETHFFEELGAWVVGYISWGAPVTPGLLNHHPKRMKKDGSPANEPLSPREREIVRLIARGSINTEIAKRLSISVRTAERSRSSIMNKLGLQTRAELVAYAVKDEVLSGGDTK